MSSFGSAYRVHTYGESHCKSVGCIIDGVPPVSNLQDPKPGLTVGIGIDRGRYSGTIE